jgi:tryptophan 2,3-dioxygenase
MHKPVNYQEYLKLNLLLSAQEPLSFKLNRPAHDEMLFITTHHSYELWFKQLLFELDSILSLLSAKKVDERWMSTIVNRLERMNLIFKNLMDQVDILETMTPLDFLEFRDLLHPASGFQSAQFRLLENRLGLSPDERMPFGNKPYSEHLQNEEKNKVKTAEKAPSLFSLIEQWLERTPFLEDKEFNFWSSYVKAVESLFNYEDQEIDRIGYLSNQDQVKAKEQMNQALNNFKLLFSEAEFNNAKAQGVWRLSYKAVRAALLIQLYRDQPVFQLPFLLLTAIQNLDFQLTQWRYRHALLARKMLGAKVGTGGSSGSQYLEQTANKHRVFKDLNQLTTYFIPRSKLPALPKSVEETLGFYFTSGKAQPH